jgi:hypothetical protein
MNCMVTLSDFHKSYFTRHSYRYLKYGLLLLSFLAEAAPASMTFGQSVGKPHLISLLHHPMDNQVIVKNVGKGLAYPTKLTLDCVKVGVEPMHSCPSLPLGFMKVYFDPAFPENATVNVPALKAGESFSHTLMFWDVSHWPTGTYKFTAVADAGHSLEQTNTKNSVATSLLTVP